MKSFFVRFYLLIGLDGQLLSSIWLYCDFFHVLQNWSGPQIEMYQFYWETVTVPLKN